MGWISQCLLFVTLTSTSAYDYRDYPNPLLDYHRYDHTQTRRSEYEQLQPFTNERIQARSADRSDERPAQRMNERSIAVTSGIQRVQEKERRRVQSWRDDSMPRSENVTFKIVNSPKYPTISNKRGGPDEMISDSVVFPGRTSAQKFVPEIPKECQDIGICEFIPNYPHDVINNIISKLGDKLDRFHIDELEEPEIAQRIGPDDNAEIDLCNFREKVIPPQAAKDKNGNWMFILNSKDNPLQGYRVEICQSVGQTCDDNIVTFYGGYTATCKQKYVQRTMAAVDMDKQEVIFDMPFRVPSCCSCVAKHTGKK